MKMSFVFVIKSSFCNRRHDNYDVGATNAWNIEMKQRHSECLAVWSDTSCKLYIMMTMRPSHWCGLWCHPHDVSSWVGGSGNIVRVSFLFIFWDMTNIFIIIIIIINHILCEHLIQSMLNMQPDTSQKSIRASSLIFIKYFFKSHIFCSLWPTSCLVDHLDVAAVS